MNEAVAKHRALSAEVDAAQAKADKSAKVEREASKTQAAQNCLDAAVGDSAAAPEGSPRHAKASAKVSGNA
jgi:hypothetical protein